MHQHLRQANELLFEKLQIQVRKMSAAQPAFDFRQSCCGPSITNLACKASEAPMRATQQHLRPPLRGNV